MDFDKRAVNREQYNTNPIVIDVRSGMSPEQIVKKYSPLELATVFRDSDFQLDGLVKRLNYEKEKSSALEQQVNRDKKTGLYNHEKFEELLEREIEKYSGLLNGMDELSLAEKNRLMETATNSRSRIPFSLIYIDVDDFSYINNTFGHHVGDQVLKQITNLISNSIPKNCDVARIGGEEIGVLAPYVLESALAIPKDQQKKNPTGITIARDLVEAVNSYEFKYVSEVPKKEGERDVIERTIVPLPKITISAGVTGLDFGGYEYFDEGSGKMIMKGVDRPKDIEERADKALRYAKNHGKNQFTVFYDNKGVYSMQNNDSFTERLMIAKALSKMALNALRGKKPRKSYYEESKH